MCLETMMKSIRFDSIHKIKKSRKHMRVENITIFLLILHPNYYNEGPSLYNYYLRFFKIANFRKFSHGYETEYQI